MTSFRIRDHGMVDTNQPIKFFFNEQPVHGLAGDTIASALLSNGIHFVGRSFKYHRPRGILTSGPEEPNALVEIDRGRGRSEPNQLATVHEIVPGMRVRSQNAWPTLSRDFGALFDVVHPLFPAGFYYKTFKWPRSFWDRVYEPIIRAIAGLGHAPQCEDPDSYSATFEHCDILIVGGGPAGLAAALSASEGGAKVILIDEQPCVGGSLLSSSAECLIDGRAPKDWVDAAFQTLKSRPNVQVLPRTTAFGYFQDNMVGLTQRLSDHILSPPENMPRERLWRVRAAHVVLAQGAIEAPIAFPGNDRPGIMLSGAAKTYLHKYGVKIGNKIVVHTSHDEAWITAFELHAAGIEVSAIVDLRESVAAELEKKAAKVGISVYINHKLRSTKGRKRVSSVEIQSLTEPSAPSQWIYCDAVAMCGGWTPSVHLYSQSKGSLTWNSERQVFTPTDDCERRLVAGASRGLWGLESALISGAEAGLRCAELAEKPSKSAAIKVEDEATCLGVQANSITAQHEVARDRSFVDFQNDVTTKDIRLAVQEGMHSIEHVKRYTTNGMATNQGKLSNINALSTAAAALNTDIPSVGLTTFRPPYTPVTIGTIANRWNSATFSPERRTPIDPWAESAGAVFEPVSLWRRARYFPKPGENMNASVNRECAAVRASLGIFDASTLGKIEAVGPDAAEFINRMYTNPFLKLAVGRCRYGVMLNEEGYIFDDGIIGRIDTNRFHITTTTGGAARVLNTMEDYLQTEWPDLRVWLTSTTEQWATIALQGPNSRRLLSDFVTDLDISDEAFPHMSVAECRIGGVSARLFRASFSGELGFEVNIPASEGLRLWSLLHDAGKRFEICPYGTETMHVLRAEKGFIIVGQDTDGTVTPDDAGLGWTIGKKKRDFVGMRSLQRPDLNSPTRKQLVGLIPTDKQTVLPEGAQIVESSNSRTGVRAMGHVTSSYWSASLDHPIALALIESGRDKLGDTVTVRSEERLYEAVVSQSVFFDQKGERVQK